MRRKRPNFLFVVGLVGGLAYPFLVYFGYHTIPHGVLLGLAILLVGLRVIALRKHISITSAYRAFGGITLLLGCLALLHAEVAVKMYPILVSLSVAALFGYSLFVPPSAVERMARLHEPDMPQEGVKYTWRVTLVWVIFLIFNAGISAATAVWGTLAQWTLWNGFVAYLLMGLLFAGEYCVRSVVRR